MEPWAWAAIGAVGTFLGWSVWLFYAGRSVGAAPIPALEAELAFALERLTSCRAALAAEVEAGEARSEGARSDFEKDRSLRAALSDPDAGARYERLLRFFPDEGGAAPPGEPPGEAE